MKKYNYGEKSLKAPFIVIADLECILEKEQSCQYNPENSYTERKATARLMQQKTGTIFIQEKIVLKSFAKM